MSFGPGYLIYKFQSKPVWLFWLVLLVLIPIFSIYGRGLQYWLLQQFTRQQLVLLFAVVLIFLSVAATVSLIRRHGWLKGWHAIWVVALFVILPFYVPLVEERFHFILFGLFGFVTLSIYPLIIGFIICFVLSGMDELLQYVLPDRVGDWRDVFFNVLAVTGGALFALVRKER